MLRALAIICMGLILASCASTKSTVTYKGDMPYVEGTPTKDLLMAIPELDGQPRITIAVYRFTDLTGQRKQSDNYASFSSAVTQGAEAWLIESLLETGDWFKVLERGQLDSIMRERAVVQQTRQDFTEDDETGLKPMLFAGLLIHVGFIGYVTN